MPPPPQLTHRRLVLVDKPGAAQSQIRIGWVGTARSTADYFPIEVMNTVLGGSMSSRLFQNVRERRGLAYSVYSGLSSYRDTGLFSVYAGCATNKVPEVIDVVLEELRALAPVNSVAEYEMGIVHAALGQWTDAATCIAAARARRTGWIAFLRVEPLYDRVNARVHV